MINLDLIAEQLFNSIKSRFSNLVLGDDNGDITNVPAEARFFDFNFSANGETLGQVSISLDEQSGVTIIHNKDIIDENYGIGKSKWFEFLKDMRQFSKKRLLKFEIRDVTRTNLQRRDYKFLAKNRPGEQKMSESKMYGTHKTSFQKFGNAKLSIKHTGNIEEHESRNKKIGTIFIENSQGEKFKYPYNHLSGARALAKHIGEGGHPFDDFGKHITSLSEELAKLRKFNQYLGRNNVMAETLEQYTGIVKERVGVIKKEIQNLQKDSYYKESVENFVKKDFADIPEDIAENWIDQLTIKQFNEELKDVFPFVYNLVSEHSLAETITFDNIMSEQSDTYHKVKPGETIYSIANQYIDHFPSGVEQGVEEIMSVNGIANPKLIQVGAELVIPKITRQSKSIGAGGTSELAPNKQATGSTRGIDPKLNYGESIDAAFDKLLGQFAEATAESEQDTDEGNAFAHAVRKAKMDGKKKGDKVKGPDGDEITLEKEGKTPLGEFILSYFDRESGQFPKGETAVLTMVEKDYGEQYIRPAQAFIEQVNNKVAEVMGYRDNELEEDNIGEGFLKNLVGDVRNAFKPGVAVTPNMVKELEAGVAAIKAGGQPTPRQQKIFDRFMSDTLPRELQKMGININEDLSQNYASDAQAIQSLLAKGARSAEETQYLTMLARKYDFYGKPENIPAAIEKATQAAGKQPGGVDGNGATMSRDGGAGNTKSYTPKDFPSMAAAMAKVDYYEPGGRITINGVPHVRDVDENGRKFFRPVEGRSTPRQGTGTPSSRLDTKGETPTRTAPTQGQPTSRLDTKGQTPSRESVELNRIKGLAGL